MQQRWGKPTLVTGNPESHLGTRLEAQKGHKALSPYEKEDVVAGSRVETTALRGGMAATGAW